MNGELHPPNRRVLLIDDTQAIHEDFRKILCEDVRHSLKSMDAELFNVLGPASNGTFELTSAYQGEEGVELARSACEAGQPFALSFVDMRMPPGFDGLETIARLWSLDPELQMVLCTAYSDYSWEEIAARLGSSDRLLLLKKPFDVVEVLQVAHTLTEKWALARQSHTVLGLLEGAVQKRTSQLESANAELTRLAAERDQALRRVERLNHLYRVLVKANELIVRARSADSLCQEACRILVEDGPFKTAWFGGIDEPTSMFKPVAWAGVAKGEVIDFKISADPSSPLSCGPSGQALIHQRVSICNDLLNDGRVAPWREEFRARGFAAAASLPVSTENGVHGVLTLYTAEPNFFGEEELGLLERLSGDLSFALNALRQEGQVRVQAAALTAAQNSIVITDAAGVISWCNPAFSQLTGYAAADVLGKRLNVLKSGKHPPEFYQQLWQTILSGRAWSGEIINRRKDGRLFTGEVTITPVLDSGGRISHHIAIQQDVTVRKTGEQLTKAFATIGLRLSAASTSREAAQIIVEVADSLLGWDACFFQSYSAAEDMVADLLVMDLIQERRTECVRGLPPHAPTPWERKAIREGGVLILRKDVSAIQPEGMPFGDVSRASASILLVPVRHGTQVSGVLSIQSYTLNAYDQTSLDTLQALADQCGGALVRIQAQERLRQTQEQLRQSQKLEAVGQLGSGVAHDFNNLLAIIRANADLITMQPAQLPLEVSDSLQQIIGAAERAGKLTHQLLVFSRKQVMTVERIEVNELVAHLSTMLKRVIGEHITFRCEYAGEAPYITGDRGMLEQVLVNLVVNARDAMPSGGQLTIATRLLHFGEGQLHEHAEAVPGPFVSLSVRDTGTGIPAEVLPRIFEPFYTTKDVGRGTGLGLSMVYGIVKQHKGWIEVSSEPGVGTTFLVFLPALKSASEEMPAALAPTVPVAAGTERILLVEDENGVRSVMRKILERSGYRIEEAISGRQAFELFESRASEFDLLLTDVVMPGGMNGHELAEKLQSRNPSLKVLFTSGYSGEILGKDSTFLQRHQARFIPKPYTVKTVLSAVRDCLENAPNPQAQCGREAGGSQFKCQ